ncbi:protein kinase domain-containing protein [Nonomuraea aurantiaca]|uniref:protein kinase domain-containing protein n=1 Tax=Nonomuraea aurantiaca TaxID=2878562 RepID=UPI001CD9C3BE|nr:protein kinase [Nonomuraea aurantiaca]MCA2222787.1 protein kinase [Nonomuraea aurantiaca]
MRLVPGDPERLGGYWLAGRLGAGGRGVVYDAYNDEGRRFAIKVPRGEVTRQLAEAVGLIKPRHLARVVGVGLDSESPYIVSEFADGPDLRQAVAVHGPYAGDELLALALALATALRTLHEAGITHRDLKPENVLLAPDGPRVIDYGMAAGNPVGGRHTYLAPEVLTGQRAGTAADVFAWGAVVLYAATGRDPFQGESLGAIMHRLLTVDPDLGELPPRLRDLVGRALAKNPADRPSATELPARGPAELRPPGGLSGPRSLGEVAEEAYASLTPAQQGELPGLLLRLLDGEEVKDDGEEPGVLTRLVAAGLLVRLSVRVEPITTEVGKLVAISDDRVAPASAALFRAWPRLRDWAAHDAASRHSSGAPARRTNGSAARRATSTREDGSAARRTASAREDGPPLTGPAPMSDLTSTAGLTSTADLTSMYVVHRAMLTDLRRLAELLTGPAELGAARGRAVRGYAAALLTQVGHHHANERDLLWPAIERAAGQSVDLTSYATGRQAFGPLLARCRAALTGEPGALGRELSELLEPLEEHLAEEESELFPIVFRFVPFDAYVRVERQVARRATLRELAFTTPWLLRHATPEEAARLLKRAGGPLRLLAAATGPGYTRRERQIFG